MRVRFVYQTGVDDDHDPWSGSGFLAARLLGGTCLLVKGSRVIGLCWGWSHWPPRKFHQMMIEKACLTQNRLKSGYPTLNGTPEQHERRQVLAWLTYGLAG